MRINLIRFLIILCTANVYCQSISGVVRDSDGLLLKNILVVLKKSKVDTQILAFTKTDEQGNFSFNIADLAAKIFFIEVRLNNYETSIAELDLITHTPTQKLEITLLKNNVNQLKEIIIKSKIPKFKIATDTISYKVDAYSDGTEVKIDEVIKKLPGIDVNNTTGEITYKGKSIETVTLDGDNLFGFNYTIGTRNISKNIVDKIETIDNYNANPLLKGIEGGGKVSLNLKLKKNKTNFATDFAIGSGLFNSLNSAYSNNATGLLTSNKSKSFTVLAHNNIGLNKSPFDYYGVSVNAEQRKERNFFAKKNIGEEIFANGLEVQRANINNQYFANNNTLFKISSKLNIKLNLYFLRDNLVSNQLTKNDYQINNINFKTIDSTFISKKPQQLRSDLELRYIISSESLLEYNIRIKKEQIETGSSLVQNRADKIETFLKTDDVYLKHNITFTKRLSKTAAFQSSILQSLNDIPQNLNINAFNGSTALRPIDQFSRYKKHYIQGVMSLLQSKKANKYSFSAGINYDDNLFLSDLKISDLSTSVNLTRFLALNFFSDCSYTFTSKKFSVSTTGTVRFLKQKLDQNTNSEINQKSSYLFEPALSVKYLINKKSSVNFDASITNKTQAESFFFNNQVIVNNRSSISNSPDLNLSQIQLFNVNYEINDLNNQFEFLAKFDYQRTKGNIFNNQVINEQNIQNRYFFLSNSVSNSSFYCKIVKYIPVFNSTLKLTNMYSQFSLFNVVNNSALRPNKNQSNITAFFWKTAFEKMFNFENTVVLENISSTAQNQRLFLNNAFSENFKIIFSAQKKWFITTSIEYFLPDIKNKNNNYFFTDLSVTRNLNKMKSRISLNIRNISNEQRFNQIQTSELAQTSFSSNILPRYFMLDYIWNF